MTLHPQCASALIQIETLHGRIWAQSFKVDQLIYEDKSDFQDIYIFGNKIFGKVLSIDGMIQTTEKDECI